MPKPLIAVVMGSRSDLPVMEETRKILKELGIPHETRILSAHRTPAEAAAFFSAAENRGLKVIVCAAGGAAHLAGIAAAHTILPVIAIPLDGSPLKGWDALLSSVMMPPGIPVAAVSVGSWGAKNAAYLAAAVLALSNAALRKKLRAFRSAQQKAILQDSVVE